LSSRQPSSVRDRFQYRSVGGALTEPVDPLVVTRIFEGLSG